MTQEIVMQRIWGKDKHQLRAEEKVLWKKPNNGKPITVEIMALPIGTVENPEQQVPIVTNWRELDEDGGNLPTFNVLIVPIESIIGAHPIQVYSPKEKID